MKPWKRDLAYIREVGPDEPRFDAAVQRVWDRCEELEAALGKIVDAKSYVRQDGSAVTGDEAQGLAIIAAREALL